MPAITPILKIQLFSLAMLMTITGLAQDTSSNKAQASSSSSPLTFSGYAEAYYSYDFNTPADNTKPGFIYSHNRHNEFNINLAFIRGAYTTNTMRGTIAVGVGTYMNANYAAEPGTLKNIYEANAGVKIGKKNLWLDAGILPSHIGLESAVSKDCWALTRSIVADNSPYFESGARLTYTTPNNKWVISGLLLNGWQRITRVKGNSLMSVGTQLQFIPSDKLLFNYSTFIGTDKPDSQRLMRYYNNLYAVISAGRFGIIPSLDFGMEQKEKGSSRLIEWYAPVLQFRYSFNERWKIDFRAEYYVDQSGVIITTNTPGGFKTSGYTLNIDYAPIPFALLRIEYRTLKSKDNIFTRQNESKSNDNFLTTSMAISF